jgi:hypothetical protein
VSCNVSFFSYHSKSTPLHYMWHKLSSLSSQTFSLSKFTPPLPPNPHRIPFKSKSLCLRFFLFAVVVRALCSAVFGSSVSSCWCWLVLVFLAVGRLRCRWFWLLFVSRETKVYLFLWFLISVWWVELGFFSLVLFVFLEQIYFRSMFLDLCFFYSSTIFVFFSFLNQTSIVNFFLLDWNISSSCFVFLRFTISLTTLIKQQS